MKHLEPRASTLPHSVFFLVILAFATQATPVYCSTATRMSQSDSHAKRDPQARQQKIANPLNDLLDEAQKDIDSNNFEAAISPLQKFIAQKSDFAYAHFQLA